MAALVGRPGATPAEVVATLAADEEHDAFMHQHFPQVAASIRASSPREANAKRAEQVAFDARTQRDPFDRPNSPRPVRIGPGSASATTIDLTGRKSVRSPGRSLPATRY
jgi:hypothetical protein